MRRSKTGVSVAIPVGVLLVLGAGIGEPPDALADTSSPTVRTFEDEPVGQPPAGATVTGTVSVDSAPFGGAGNHAVHLTDPSTTTQSKVHFTQPAAAARSFEFDVSLHQVQQPLFVAVHGTGDRPDLGAWRFMIAPVHGRNPAAQVSVYSGTAWQRLAVIPQLTERDLASRVRIDASPEVAVFSVGEFVFRTTTRASASTAITGVELASSGGAPTGTDAYLDNLAVADLAADAPSLSAGTVPVGLLSDLTAGRALGYDDVATVAAPGRTEEEFVARVYVGGRWVDAKVEDDDEDDEDGDEAGALVVRAMLDESEIGLHPVTVTLTDLRTGVERSAQMRIQSYAPIATSLVAQEPAGAAEPRFPDAIRLDDGRLLVVYHYADGHTRANGVVRAVTSDDDGATWSAPRTVVENGFDNRDPKLVQLRDGTILLTTFRTDWSTSSSGTNLGTFLFRSDDGGQSFPTSTKIDSAQPGAWQHAPAVELPNGDILQPLYGYGARVARSTDGGRTFPAANEQTVVADDVAYANVEPNISLLPDGELVMLIRTADWVLGAEVASRLTRSFDGGRTWTPVETTDLPTSSHHQLVTEDGSVLVVYGNQAQAGRPSYAVLITEPSASWTGYRSVPVYNSGWDDQANNSSVQLSDGSFLTFGFDVADRSVVSWETKAKTYR